MKNKWGILRRVVLALFGLFLNQMIIAVICFYCSGWYVQHDDVFVEEILFYSAFVFVFGVAWYATNKSIEGAVFAFLLFVQSIIGAFF